MSSEVYQSSRLSEAASSVGDQTSESNSYVQAKETQETKNKSGVTVRYVWRPSISTTIPAEFQRFANFNMNRDEESLILEAFE